MIRRLVLPRRTAISLAAMISRCQFGASSACGFRSGKQRATKVAKSCRSRTSYSARVRFAIISLRVQEPRPELLEDLLVRRGEEGGLGGGRLALSCDVAKDVEQDLDGAPIGGGRAVDELGDNRFALGDLATAAILGDDDELVKRVTQQLLQVLRAGRPAARIAGLTF